MLIPITAAEPIVDLDEVREHLRVDHSDDDAYITALIGAASTAVAERTERTIGLRTWELRLDSKDVLYGCDVRLPGPPLVEVTSASYRDADGISQTYATTDYRVFGINAPHGGGLRMLTGALWPSLQCGPEALTIRYRAGYAEVPEDIRHAVLLIIGQLYASRGELVKSDLMEDPGIKALLAPYRVWGV